MAIRWLLQRDGVASVILGARTVDQLEENLGALGWALSDGEMAELDAIGKHPLPYPYWHQDMADANRP
ncbi:MAG: aldo/keto reductase [Thermocrispum sp.]